MSNMGVASDLSLGRPCSIMGRPLFPSNPLARLSESSNISLHTRLDLAQLESYVRALEDEREKIDAFRRELPICMRLLDDAIEASRLKLTSTALTGSITSHASYSSCFNKATLPSEVPMWKANWEKQEADNSDDHEDKVEASLSGWNKPLELNDQYTQEQGNITWNRANILQRGISPARCVQLELMKQIKADSFNESNSDYLHGMDAQPVIDHASPTSAGAAGVRTSTALGQQPRKARRCWSPELHQRFLHALHQLGGPQLATPKQIREVMGVEGLTNDEVKSHLQKFRLHTRRPVNLQASHEPAQQPHQLVVFGGIWVPTSPAEPQPAQVAGASTCNQDQPMRSLCHAAAAGGGHHARSVSDHHHNTYMHAQFQHTRPNVIGQTPMQTMLNATFSDQLEIQAGMEAASVEDVARSDQSTSLNGEAAGLDNQHEEEDTEIHLGSKRLSREINSPLNAKARY